MANAFLNINHKNKLAILALSSTLFIGSVQAGTVPPNNVAQTTAVDGDVTVSNIGEISVAGVAVTVDSPGASVTLDPDNVTASGGLRSTGSVAVVVDATGGGSTIDVGNGTSKISSITTAFLIQDAASVTVINAGTIQGKGATFYGINAITTPNLTINNNTGGTIINSDARGVGIFGTGSDIAVTVTNDTGALIEGGVGYGISFFDANGTLTNAGTVKGVTQGILTDNLSASTLTIDNQDGGIIQATGGDGIELEGFKEVNNQGTIEGTARGISVSADATGSITNQSTGTIKGGTNSIEISNNVNFTGNILNEGLVTGATRGIYFVGGTTIFTGDITNTSTGTIQVPGANYGIELNGATFTGNILNQGLIQSTDVGLTLPSLRNNVTNFTGNVTNTGTIDNQGAGLAFDSNTAITGTIDNQGTIKTAGPVALSVGGAVSGGVFNSGTISATGFSVAIASNSAFTQTAGTLIGKFQSAGANTTFSGGTVNGDIALNGAIDQTLKIGNTTVTGAITGDDGQNHTLEITNNFTNAAAIDDFRNLNVSGGTFTVNNPLTLSSTDDGTLDVQNGATLDINSTLEGAPVGKTTTATILAGGTLNVNTAGTLQKGAGDLDLVNQGTFSVSETGTVNITKIDNTAGVINLEVSDNTTFSKINLTGGAGTSDVTGGTFNVSLTGNGLVKTGAANAIEVLKSGGNITGTNNIVIGQPASQTLTFINGNAGAADNVSLVAVRTPFQAIGNNVNANNVGAALDGLVNDPNLNPDLQALMGQIDILPTQQAVSDALESLAPDSSGSMVEMSQLTHHKNLQNTVGRIDQARNLKDFITTPIAGDEPYYGLGAWGKVYANSLTQKNQGEFRGYNANSIGFITGVDKNFVPEWTIGGAFAYTSGDAEGKSNFNNDLKFTSLQFVGYSSYSQGAWYLDALGSAAINSYKTTRNIEVGTFRRTAKANFKAWQYSGKLESGYNLASGKYRIVPIVGLTYDMLDMDGYTESTAGGVSLAVEPRNVPQLVGSVGIRFASLNEYVEALYVPEVRFFIHQDFIGDNLIKTSNFVSAGSVGFESRSAKPDPTTYNFGTALTAYTNNLIFSVNYDLEIRSQFFGHYGSFKLRYEW